MGFRGRDGGSEAGDRNVVHQRVDGLSSSAIDGLNSARRCRAGAGEGRAARAVRCSENGLRFFI